MERSYGTAFIKAEQINKNYVLRGIIVYALKGISFELYRGEPIVILGSSGSGKGTLLDILDGIETVTSGRPLYGGKGLNQKDKKALTAYRRAHVGSVFQLYDPMPRLTALENVELVAELGEHPLDAGRLTKQVGLADWADHFSSKPSGGQQQRVVIAKALHRNPDTLLYDEPTGALGSRTGVQIPKLLTGFNRAYQKVIVLTTHNQKIAQVVYQIFYFKDRYLECVRQNESPLRPEEVGWW